METRKIVNRRIEDYRTNILHISQEAFAVKLGMEPKKGRSTVNNWEQGAIQVKSEDLSKIASTFGVSIDYLLGFEEFPALEHDVKIAHNVTGLSSDTLAFLETYKDDEGGAEWKIIRMVEKLIQHPGLLSALCMVNDRAGLVASSMAADPEPVLDLPGDKLQDGSIDKWPQEQVRLHAVQAWETELDAALFKVSNAAVRFAETVLGVKEVQDNLAEEDKALSKQLHENMPVEQEG